MLRLTRLLSTAAATSPASSSSLFPAAVFSQYGFDVLREVQQSTMSSLQSLIQEPGRELYRSQPLMAMVKASYQKQDFSVLNYASLLWATDFFVAGLRNEACEMPTFFQRRVDADFGSADKFKEQVMETGMSVFGSGFVWVVEKDQKLSVEAMFDAKTPLLDEKSVPLLGVSVWEHAYLPTHGSKREAYLKAALNHVDWQTVQRRLQQE